jgi:hypothetical protein
VTLDGTALDSAELVWDATGILYRVDSTDSTPRDWCFGKLVVVFTAGYSTLSSVPLNLQRACILLSKGFRSAAQRDPLVKSESVPGVLDTSYWVGGAPGTVGNMPPDVAGLLDPYREISV